MRIVKGRTLNRGDSEKAPAVALVNETFVKKFYPNEDPIGKRVIMTEARPDEKRPSVEQTIVGVIADYKNTGIEKPAGSEIIVPAWQYSELSVPPDSLQIAWVVVRSEKDPSELIPAITRVVNELDPSLPISHMRPMNDVMWEAIARPRFLTFLLGTFAAIALLLAAVGIYGVMSHTVAQRTHEIGLRVALGAPPRQVRNLVMRQAGSLIAIGIAAGLTAAFVLQWLLGPSLASLFYGSKLSTPLMSGFVTFVVTITALLATLIPVRRALRVQPTVALRSE
jgi:putative ABC transport system permease protein